jgi:hypothetical protein
METIPRHLDDFKLGARMKQETYYVPKLKQDLLFGWIPYMYIDYDLTGTITVEEEDYEFTEDVLGEKVYGWLPYGHYAEMGKDAIIAVMDKFRLCWIPEYDGIMWLAQKEEVVE